MAHEDEAPKPVWLQQSPIDVVDSLFAGGLRSLRFRYPNLIHGVVTSPEEDPGYSFKLTGPETAYLEFSGQHCPLRKVHLHAPSEHKIASREFPLEIHLVHEIPDPRWGSKFVVVAVFVDEPRQRKAGGSDEHPFAAVARSLHTNGLDTLEVLNPNHCLPKQRGFYRYEGSLTTPKFDEIVSWILMREPLRVFASDLEELRKRALHHAHPTQPQNRRFVLRNFR